MKRGTPDARRVARERQGRWAEYVAAGWLMAHGYRVLARRHRTPYGELDLIGRRGKRIAFVEVKLRRTLQDGYDALNNQQMMRMYQAAEHWISRYPALAEYEQGFDAIIVLPWARPVYLRDACQPTGYERE